MGRTVSITALAGLAVVGVLFSGLIPGVQAADERVIYLALIEPKGGVTVDKEPFPAEAFPKGGGYVKKAPDPNGRWEVSVYQFSPATVIVKQGERVVLEIVGINGAKHTVHVDKYLPKHSLVKRGDRKSVGGG